MKYEVELTYLNGKSKEEIRALRGQVVILNYRNYSCVIKSKEGIPPRLERDIFGILEKIEEALFPPKEDPLKITIER